MSTQAPAGKEQSLQERAAKELKQRWWLWGSIVFTVLLVGSLFIFMGYLYDTATHGLPFLAGADWGNLLWFEHHRALSMCV